MIFTALNTVRGKVYINPASIDAVMPLTGVPWKKQFAKARVVCGNTTYYTMDSVEEVMRELRKVATR